MDNMKMSQEISAFVGKIMRDHFGKGPESAFTSFGDHYVTVYLKNFMSPMERVLQEQNHNAILSDVREKLMEKIAPEIKAYIEVITNNPVDELYYDWGLHNQSGMIVGICDQKFPESDKVLEEFDGKEQIEKAIIKLSHYAQKVPEEIKACRLNPRTIVVKRNGILVRIEKELIRRGLVHQLKDVKRGLEKRFLHNNIDFEGIIGHDIADIFVDWDFVHDRSVIVIVNNLKQPKPIQEVEMN